MEPIPERMALVTARQSARGADRGQPAPQGITDSPAPVGAAGDWRLAGIPMSCIAGTPGAPPRPQGAHR
jgi:hypothetical protein